MSILYIKKKTAVERRISDWSSVVCSADRKEQVAERGRTSGCFRRLPCGQNIDQCRASDKGEGSERQFAPRIARPGKRRQRGEIKGLARDQIGRASCREGGCQYV